MQRDCTPRPLFDRYNGELYGFSRIHFTKPGDAVHHDGLLAVHSYGATKVEY